jgi:phosphoribosylformylglycinamidine cyclo-ligase
VVRTIAVNGTMTARWPKSKIISNEKIQAGDVIVGLAGYGKADYEESYNSGIASNGLTSARHDVLHKSYATKYPESFDPSLDQDVVYIGPHKLTDHVDGHEIGKLLLSPTRTFAPVLKELLESHFDSIHGLIHCSGGGQTKCLKYIPDNMRVVKDNLFEPPPIFKLIQEASKADDREMYQVFNMGTRLEIYTNEKNADKIIGVALDFGVNAQVVGTIQENQKKELHLKTANGVLIY